MTYLAFIAPDSNLFVYGIVPLLIFLARVSDVTIGTLRIVFVSKGFKFLAPILGFFEILIWLIAMSKIFQNLDNWFYYVAYAMGFATGNYVGLKIEERMALGYVNLRIVTALPGNELIESLTKAGYGVTHIKAQGSQGNVNVIFCIVKRKYIEKIRCLLKEYNPNAFYTIEDIRFANLSYTSSPERISKRRFYLMRKGK